MLAPPLELGAVNAATAWVLPAVIVVKVGAPGTLTTAVGVTDIALEAAPAPAELLAVTLQL